MEEGEHHFAMLILGELRTYISLNSCGFCGGRFLSRDLFPEITANPSEGIVKCRCPYCMTDLVPLMKRDLYYKVMENLGGEIIEYELHKLTWGLINLWAIDNRIEFLLRSLLDMLESYRNISMDMNLSEMLYVAKKRIDSMRFEAAIDILRQVLQSLNKNLKIASIISDHIDESTQLLQMKSNIYGSLRPVIDKFSPLAGDERMLRDKMYIDKKVNGLFNILNMVVKLETDSSIKSYVVEIKKILSKIIHRLYRKEKTIISYDEYKELVEYLRRGANIQEDVADRIINEVFRKQIRSLYVSMELDYFAIERDEEERLRRKVLEDWYLDLIKFSLLKPITQKAEERLIESLRYKLFRAIEAASKIGDAPFSERLYVSTGKEKDITEYISNYNKGVLVILGNVGSGKTTLAVKTSLELLDSDILVFFYPLKLYSYNQLRGRIEYLIDTFKKRHQKIVFVLDGLDEINYPCKVIELISENIKKGIFFIVTSWNCTWESLDCREQLRGPLREIHIERLDRRMTERLIENYGIRKAMDRVKTEDLTAYREIIEMLSRHPFIANTIRKLILKYPDTPIHHIAELYDSLLMRILEARGKIGLYRLFTSRSIKLIMSEIERNDGVLPRVDTLGDLRDEDRDIVRLLCESGLMKLNFRISFPRYVAKAMAVNWINRLEDIRDVSKLELEDIIKIIDVTKRPLNWAKTFAGGDITPLIKNKSTIIFKNELLRYKDRIISDVELHFDKLARLVVFIAAQSKMAWFLEDEDILRQLAEKIKKIGRLDPHVGLMGEGDYRLERKLFYILLEQGYGSPILNGIVEEKLDRIAQEIQESMTEDKEITKYITKYMLGEREIRILQTKLRAVIIDENGKYHIYPISDCLGLLSAIGDCFTIDQLMKSLSIDSVAKAQKILANLLDMGYVVEEKYAREPEKRFWIVRQKHRNISKMLNVNIPSAIAIEGVCRKYGVDLKKIMKSITIYQGHIIDIERDKISMFEEYKPLIGEPSTWRKTEIVLDNVRDLQRLSMDNVIELKSATIECSSLSTRYIDRESMLGFLVVSNFSRLTLSVLTRFGIDTIIITAKTPYKPSCRYHVDPERIKGMDVGIKYRDGERRFSIYIDRTGNKLALTIMRSAKYTL